MTVMHTSFLLQGVYYKYISLPIVTVDISFMQKYFSPNANISQAFGG